jgi:cellulose synthase/poly-beta-1,6-N-acetylglucosamine synthase-like glycosyltransferase
MNAFWVLLVVGGGFMMLALHPFLTYPASLLIARRLCGKKFRKRASVEGEEHASVAFVLCAYNEAAVIEDKIKNLLEIRRQMPHCSVHVYCDGCTDQTVTILQRYQDDVRVVVGAGRQGKSAGMNTLMKGVDAEFIAFTDANVIITPRSAQLMPGYFADPTVGCVCGQLTYSNPDDSTTSATGSAYWRFEEWLKGLESDVDSTVAADGALFVVRRSLWREVPTDIIDDAFTSTSVFCQGLDVVQANDIHAWEMGAVSSPEEFRRKIRIACRTFNCTLLLWGKLRATSTLRQYMYFSHKFLRWLTIYNLLLAAIFFGSALASRSLAALSIAGICLFLVFLLGAAGVWPFATLLESLMSFLAAGLGVFQSLRGQRYITWTPAGSTREVPTVPTQDSAIKTE